MIIKNGLVFQEDGSFVKKDLYIENGRLAASEAEVSDKTEYDAEGLKVFLPTWWTFTATALSDMISATPTRKA